MKYSDKIELIKQEMNAAGLSFTGCYSELPETIYYAIEMVNTFGFDYWLQKTTAGPAVKNIVKKLSAPIGSLSIDMLQNSWTATVMLNNGQVVNIWHTDWPTSKDIVKEVLTISSDYPRFEKKPF